MYVYLATVKTAISSVAGSSFLWLTLTTQSVGNQMNICGKEHYKITSNWSSVAKPRKYWDRLG